MGKPSPVWRSATRSRARPAISSPASISRLNADGSMNRGCSLWSEGFGALTGLWLAAETGRFAAVAALDPIVDLSSLFGPAAFVLGGAAPWDDPGLYRQNSALSQHRRPNRAGAHPRPRRLPAAKRSPGERARLARTSRQRRLRASSSADPVVIDRASPAPRSPGLSRIAPQPRCRPSTPGNC